MRLKCALLGAGADEGGKKALLLPPQAGGPDNVAGGPAAGQQAGSRRRRGCGDPGPHPGQHAARLSGPGPGHRHQPSKHQTTGGQPGQVDNALDNLISGKQSKRQPVTSVKVMPLHGARLGLASRSILVYIYFIVPWGKRKEE
jgi:hypothetical protein